MPAETRIDAEQGVIFTKAWGMLSVEAVLAARELLRNVPQFSPNMKQLIDLSGVTDVAQSSDIVGLARTDPFGVGARRAFVAPTDLAFGVMRQYQARLFNKDVTAKVFRGIAEACEWLGIEYSD